MIILEKRYWHGYYQILAIIFCGLVWHLGKYGSSGEYIIAMLLLLIYWDSSYTRKIKEGKDALH